MAEDIIQLSALLTIRDKAQVELERCKKEFEKAQEKVKAAQTKLNTLEETLNMIKGSVTTAPSRKDLILKIIKAYEGNSGGISVSEILEKLKDEGYEIKSQNPSASVHMAADQLCRDGLVEIFPTAESGKLYRAKAALL